MVALLAALAALLAPLGVGSAAGVAAPGRSAVAGAEQTGPAGAAYGVRHKAAREMREGVAARGQRSQALIGQRTDTSPPLAPTALGVLLLAVLVAAAGWWSRGHHAVRAPVDRTVGRRPGRGPPALRCA